MRRNTDEDEYKLKEIRQMRPGQYHISAVNLLPNTRALLPNDTRIRSQITGSSVSSTLPPVNTESDLRGLGRPINRAALAQSGHHMKVDSTQTIQSVDVPHLRTLDTRLDMPALALRGATPNRFHPNILHDPTDFAFAPFDRMVSSRIVMKDQWRVPVSSLSSVHPPTIPASVQIKPAY